MTVRNLNLSRAIDPGPVRIIFLGVLLLTFGCSTAPPERDIVVQRSLHVDPSSVDIGREPVDTTSVVALHFEGDSTLLYSLPNKLEIEPGEHIVVPVRQGGSATSENTGERTVELTVRISPDLSAGDWDASIRFAPDNASTDGATVNLHGTVSGPQMP
jgi:hypothetical protein